jgi:hypothetical protein
MKVRFPFAQPCAEPQIPIEVTLRSCKFNGKPRTGFDPSGNPAATLVAACGCQHTTLGRQGIITLPTPAKGTAHCFEATPVEAALEQFNAPLLRETPEPPANTNGGYRGYHSIPVGAPAKASATKRH